MGNVEGSVEEDGVWDRAGVPMKAEGAVVWLATSKQKSSAPFDTPCCKHKPPHVHKAKSTLINHRTIEYAELEGINQHHQVQLLEPTK